MGTTWANERIDLILGHNIALIKAIVDWAKERIDRFLGHKYYSDKTIQIKEWDN